MGLSNLSPIQELKYELVNTLLQLKWAPADIVEQVIPLSKWILSPDHELPCSTAMENRTKEALALIADGKIKVNDTRSAID